uniref:Uncharacterized protein n=1 Tax=Hyaloperonospora arabidopsidis (strain Emoy2) TaxID=559515 RepID=M4BQ43_HYAAE
MQEVQGDAAFDSFPDERFRFGVGPVDGVDTIWLESSTEQKRWTCDVADVTSFAPADVVLPQKTVLHYVAASLKNSASENGEDANRGPQLVRGDADKTLQLEVLIQLGVADFAWAPKYVFPLTLVSPMSPAEAQAHQLTLLTTQVQELQQEVQMLKKQLQTVLQASTASQPVAALVTTGAPLLDSADSRPPPVPMDLNADSTVSKASTVPSRGAQVWGDIIGHPQHKLVQTDEIRETRNALGVTIRSHRQHTCKVCSLLRGTRSRASGTSYYCPECTERHNGGMVYLCDKTRPHDPSKYRNASCTQIWHLMWDNGKSIPQTGTASIRMRKKRKDSDLSQSETIPPTVLMESSSDVRS